MRLADSLLRETVSRFPRYAKSGIKIEPVEKGGSDRKYYRVRIGGEHSLILVKYGDGRAENRHYVAIAQFLASLEIHVPEIYFHDENEQLIWMEDLGERDLWSFRNEPWETRRELYASTLDELVALHARAHHALPDAGLTLEAEFNADLYAWEQNYFFENCAHRYFGSDRAECDRDALREIASQLHELPRVLVHRDFQSQNILIDHDRAHLIDFQGLRPGLAPYDLASLIYDPYVALPESERAELQQTYIEKAQEAGVEISKNFHEIFDLCAMQRLMQALGAYGFLGLVKRRTHFLDHIPIALHSLREVTARIKVLRELPELLADFCDNISREK